MCFICFFDIILAYSPIQDRVACSMSSYAIRPRSMSPLYAASLLRSRVTDFGLILLTTFPDSVSVYLICKYL